MLSLEMIGFYRDAPKSQSYPVAALKLLYPDEGNFIAIVAPLGDFSATRRVKALFRGASDLPVVSINAPRFAAGRGFLRSRELLALRHAGDDDHRHLVPAKPQLPRSGDTPETLDYARMAKVVRAVHAVAMEF